MIQDIIDVIDLFDTIASDVLAAKADGSINLLDLPKFIDVFPAMQKAVDGADKIAGEIKGASADEIKLLVQRLISSVEGIASAVSGSPVPAEVDAAIEKALDLVHFVLKTWLVKA